MLLQDTGAEAYRIMEIERKWVMEGHADRNYESEKRDHEIPQLRELTWERVEGRTGKV